MYPVNILYATYLLVAAVILLFLAVIGWRRRSVPTNREFALFSASVGFMLAAYALELTQENLDGLKQSERLLWFFGSYTSTFWLLFSLVWSGYGHVANRFLRAALLAFSTITMLLAQTNDYHGLIYTRMWMDSSGPFPILQGQEGLWYRVYWSYINGCNLIINILFVRQFRNVRPLHRRQALIMVLASIIPWLTDIGYELGVGDGLFLTAFGLSITALLCAWGVFRQQLLAMAPVARHGLVEMMRDPVLVIDEAGRVVDHNLAACRLLHDEGHHVAEATREDIHRRAPELLAALDRVQQGEADTFHYKDQIFSLSVTVLYPTPDQTLTLCLLHNITEQSRAEEELRLSENSYRELSASLQERVEEETKHRVAQERLLANQSRLAAMGEMISAIAHQWRQPLATLGVIVQRTYAMATMNGLTPEYLSEFKTNAMRQVKHMSDTIEEFRGFYRPEKTKEPFSPVACISDSIRLFEPQFTSSGIEVTVTGPGCDHLLAYGYPNEFKQVILNLLGNARDAILESREKGAGPENGIIGVTVTGVAGTCLTIDVSDNGCGIPADAAAKIFDPYFTTKEEKGGTGIGLYMSRMIVEDSLGGRILLLPGQAATTIRIELSMEPPP